MQDIVVPFIAIFAAELFDKSQLSILLLSSRTKSYGKLFLGALLAFCIVDGAAVLFGSFVTKLIPMYFVQIISGVVFIFFGIRSLREKYHGEGVIHGGKGAFLAAFSLVFFTEWGDKTQIASAAFSAIYNPLGVFVGVVASLAILSVGAIYFGHFLSLRIDRKYVTKAAGILFLIIGVGIIFFTRIP